MDKEQAFFHLENALTVFCYKNKDFSFGKSGQKLLLSTTDVCDFDYDEQEEIIEKRFALLKGFWDLVVKDIPLAKLQGVSEYQHHDIGIFRWEITICGE